MKKLVYDRAEPGQLNTKDHFGAKSIFYNKPKGASKQYSDWFRGRDPRLNPDRASMVPEGSVAEHVLDGWVPDVPHINKDTKITAFGSCFAANISKWLGQRNYRVSINDADAQDAYVVSIGEGMVNSFVIRQQFEWAWEGKTFDEALWRGYNKEVYGYSENVRQQTQALFDSTDVFVLTFGLSEVWYDAESNNVFWRTVPKEFHDPERHKFRVSTVEENTDNIEAIYQMIRKHRPDAKIIATLSPVPLIATFRGNSSITSNAVSKSTLRVAIDQVVQAHKDEGYLHYWPSYELVTDVFKSPFKSDRRHIKTPVLDFIMTQFEHSWCENDRGELPSLLEAWVKAKVAAGFLPAKLEQLIERRNGERILRTIEKKEFSTVEDADENRALLRALVAEWGDAPKD